LAQSDTSGNAISAALPEEHQLMGEQYQKGENSEGKAELKRKDARHLRITRNLTAKPMLTSRPKSSTALSSVSQTLPTNELEARDGVTTTAVSEDDATLQNEVTNSSSGRSGEYSSNGSAGGGEMAPLPMSEVAEAPVLISRTVPHYPERARLLGIEGLVRLEAILNREGRIEQEIKVLESIPVLDEAARAALKQWHFKPARDDSGRPVRVILEVPFQFTLK
jgi:protein TonB